ncbi:MAG TPA: inositol phosphate phosphatase SopB, partial [Noviherbaspirillum sp.]
MIAVQSNREKFMDGGRGLEASLRLIEGQVRDGSLPADMHKKFEKNLQTMLADHLYTEHVGPGMKGGTKYAKKEAQRLYKEGVVQSLNDRPWETIHTSFDHAGQTFTCDMTPASQMKLGQKDIFKNQYNGKGVCSSTTKSEHSPNLWSTRFTMTGRDGQPKTLVSAVRHGINEAYGVRSKKKREKIALERSEEVILTTLKNIKEPELRRALQTGEPIKLKLSSTSLVTAMNFFSQTEGTQMKGQVKAWNTLTEMSARNGGIEIEVNDGNVPKKVKVELDVAAFNFGVNEAALTQKIKLGPLKLKLNAGWSAADKVNEAGLKKLLGDDLSAGSEQGWAGNYIRNNPKAKNIELVKALRKQICEIWAT